MAEAFALSTSRPTPGISCEAVPAFEVDHRGHEAALLPRNGAAESFVSFIPLFDSAGAPERPRHTLLDTVARTFSHRRSVAGSMCLTLRTLKR